MDNDSWAVELDREELARLRVENERLIGLLQDVLDGTTGELTSDELSRIQDAVDDHKKSNQQNESKVYKCDNCEKEIKATVLPHGWREVDGKYYCDACVNEAVRETVGLWGAIDRDNIKEG